MVEEDGAQTSKVKFNAGTEMRMSWAVAILQMSEAEQLPF